MFTLTTIVQDQTRRSKLSFLKYGLSWRTYSRRSTLWLEVTPIQASTIESTHFSERQVTTSLGIYPKGILVFVYKSYAEHPGFHRFRAWGSLKFFIEHSLGERADYLLLLGDSVSQCILCLCFTTSKWQWSYLLRKKAWIILLFCETAHLPLP